MRGAQRRREPARTVFLRKVRLISRFSRIGRYTARDLRDRCVPMVSIRRVQKLIPGDPHLYWERATCYPTLTSAHCAYQVGWAREMLVKGIRFCRRVIFSDENRFSLDGPYGINDE